MVSWAFFQQMIVDVHIQIRKSWLAVDMLFSECSHGIIFFFGVQTLVMLA